MLYKKPEIKTYSAGDLLEAMGPCQSQYTTVTLNPTTGNSGGNVDGVINYYVSTGVLFNIITDTAGIGNGAGDFEDPLSGGDTGVTMRSVIGFRINSIPAGSTIVSATLRLYQTTPDGNPSSLGNVVVDRVDFGDSIDAADISISGTELGTISSDLSAGASGYKTLDVTSAVRQDFSDGKSNAQFRIRTSPLQLNSNATNDNIGYSSTEDNSNLPELVVTYR